MPTVVTNNPFRYRGYYYDIDLGLYYLNARYYDANTGRFISADSYVSTGQGLIGYNMYAYCGNNPVMYFDPAGEAWWTVIGLVLVGAYLITNLTSSEKQEATPEQIEKAIEAANQADVNPRNDNSTVDIKIDTEQVIDSVDEIAYEYYYQRLYERSLEVAEDNKIPLGNLMTKKHIKWEFRLHMIGYKLGFESCKKTDLNVEETPWEMFKRALGW